MKSNRTEELNTTDDVSIQIAVFALRDTTDGIEYKKIRKN